MRTHKYNAKPVVIDGIRFASTAEGRRYSELKLLVRAGEINDLELQPKFPLNAGIVYIADFSYCEKGKEVVEDVKGVETQVFRIKAKMFRELYPKKELRIVK